MIKKFKVKALTTLVVANICATPSTFADSASTGFYEEDAKFNQVAESSTLGYGWRKDAVQALSFDTDQGGDTGGCFGGDICVGPGDDDSWDWSGWDSGNTDDWGDTDGGDDGGGGDGGSDNSDPSESEECKAAEADRPSDCSPTTRPDMSANGCTGVPDSFGSANFTGACNSHDYCYGTLGASKSGCDARFEDDLRDACDSAYGPVDTGGRDGEPEFEFWDPLLYSQCNATASTYYTGVGLVGYSFYSAAQKDATCDAWHDKKDAACS